MRTKELESYQRDGFLLKRKFFDVSEVENIRNEVKLIFINQMFNRGIIHAKNIDEAEFEEGIVNLFNNYFEVYANCGKQAQHLISLHRLSLTEKLISQLIDLGIQFPVISTRPVLYFNKSSLAKAEEFYKVPPHQDWRSMQGSLNSIVVWIPLADVPEELGALKIIPKSHKNGLLESKENIWFRQITDIDQENFMSVEVEAGDALFFSSFLVHSSGNNILDKIRWSCHFRYNDLDEKTFIDRGYPHPYIYKPVQELLTTNFPSLKQVQDIFSS